MIIFFFLRGPLNILPTMITELLEASVSLKRVEAFLAQDEISKYTTKSSESISSDNTPMNPPMNPPMVQNAVKSPSTIGVTNATFKWHKKSNIAGTNTGGAFTLKNLTINFPVGKLSLVCKYSFDLTLLFQP